MRSYTVTEFRENLASALDRAADELVVIRRNGREYEIRPRVAGESLAGQSGLDVPAIETATAATLDSVLEDLKASRTRR